MQIVGYINTNKVVKRLRTYKSNWLRRVTRMNNNKMPKIMTYYRLMDEKDLEDLGREN